MDIVAKVYEIFGKIYALAEQAKANKTNCKNAATRCRSIERIVNNCANEYSRYNGINDQQREGFDLLLQHVTQLYELVTKYSKRNFFMRGMKANSFKASYEKLDKEMSTDIQIIQTGLGATTIQQNNDLLESTKVIMGLDEKMDEAIAKLDEISVSLQKKKSTEKAKEIISSAFDENEIDASDIDFNEFNDLVGKGGQGEVFRVKQRRFTRAAKVVSLRGLTEDRRRKIYDGVRKELAMMCRVDRCDNTIRVFGVVRNIPDKLILVMEYASKGSLRKYLDNATSPLGKEELLNFVQDVASGMEYIYSKGVEHRDLKADNVLLDEHHGELVAKVCDFGLSKCEELVTHTASMSKGTGGTLAWKAPEEFDDAPFNEKCDVYSFAVVIWEIITRQNPWRGLGASKIISKVVQGKRPALNEETYTSLYGENVVEVMKMCWQQEADERPTFAKAMYLLAETKLSKRPASTDVQRKERERRERERKERERRERERKERERRERERKERERRERERKERERTERERKEKERKDKERKERERNEKERRERERKERERRERERKEKERKEKKPANDYDFLFEKYKNEFPEGTPLVCACEKGRVEDVEGMIRGARAAGMDVTAMVSEVGTDSYDNRWTPLMIAAYYEHSTIIEILLQYNADTATTNHNGYNALHYAAINTNKTTTTVQLLLNNMKLEDINHINTYGDTPLDRCYYNNSSIKQQLIKLIRQKGGKRASGGCCIVS